MATNIELNRNDREEAVLSMEANNQLDVAPALEIEGLTVGYEGKVIVDQVCLAIPAGKILSLVGPNGTGKSTILKTITGSLHKMGGRIAIAGRDMQSLSALESARSISVLLTHHSRTDLLTCRDIVEAGRYPYTGRMGSLSAEDHAKVDWAMDLVNVTELASRDFMHISDGQRQRVLLARAICQEPDVLVLDEPTTYLDIRYQAELASILQTLATTKNCAIIASMHEIQLAKKMSDIVACVKDGKLMKVGEPSEVLTKETIQMMFDLSEEGFELMFGRQDSPKPKGKRLRCGWTTGTCAAAATRAAAQLLLTGSAPSHVSLTTPAGSMAVLEIEDSACDGRVASCTVIKDSGDDPDVTNGMPIVSQVTLKDEPGIIIDGGEGVGRVTRPGLDQPVGEAAINSVPRLMIEEQALAAIEDAQAQGGLNVTICLPKGKELAEKTFNPRLGIEGGISVLGTSGVVKPMSEEALIASIRAEMSMRKAEGCKNLLMSPGNYGSDFARDVLGIEGIEATQCSNFIGISLDMAVEMGFESVLLVAHVGKLAKVAAGVMNTHSHVADARREVIATHAILNGANADSARFLMDCTTTDDAIDELKCLNINTQVMSSIMVEIQKNLKRRSGAMRVESMMFSKVHGLLAQSEGAQRLLDLIKKENAEGDER